MFISSLFCPFIGMGITEITHYYTYYTVTILTSLLISTYLITRNQKQHVQKHVYS